MMRFSKGVVGAAIGAVLAVLWLTFDGGAVLLVAALAAVGWLIGTVLDRPDRVIALLQRLQEE